MRLLIVWSSMLLGSVLALAHGGGLDSRGCHNDRQNGGYHCHRGPLAGRIFFSPVEAERALAGSDLPDLPGPDAGLPDAPPGPAPHDAVSVPYDRALYRHWIDEDGDCLDTRQEVLIAESLVSPVLEGCRVVSGLWYDPLTGSTLSNPSALEVDHFVPLAEVHRSGGSRWTPEMRQAYANDLAHSRALIAVSRAANRSKGAPDPAGWLPPNEAYRCEYVRTWVLLKATWGLSMDEAEVEAIRGQLQACP
jgi:hypothetical protein